MESIEVTAVKAMLMPARKWFSSRSTRRLVSRNPSAAPGRVSRSGSQRSSASRKARATRSQQKIIMQIPTTIAIGACVEASSESSRGFMLRHGGAEAAHGLGREAQKHGLASGGLATGTFTRRDSR